MQEPITCDETGASLDRPTNLVSTEELTIQIEGIRVPQTRLLQWGDDLGAAASFDRGTPESTFFSCGTPAARSRPSTGTVSTTAVCSATSVPAPAGCTRGSAASASYAHASTIRWSSPRGPFERLLRRPHREEAAQSFSARNGGLL